MNHVLARGSRECYGLGGNDLVNSVLTFPGQQRFELLDEMYASLADRSTRRLLRTLANVDLLAVDELGYLR